jgi:mannan endo-1,4-beta-mannosidase
VLRCDRANTLRSVIGTWGIKISTGGGTDLPTSLQSQFWRYKYCFFQTSSYLTIHSCKNLDIIALHDYNLDPSYVAGYIDGAKAKAASSGKRMIYEEFGATGSSKQSQLKAVTDKLIAVSLRLALPSSRNNTDG